MPHDLANDVTDEELARQSRAGSVASFEALLIRYQTRCMRFLIKRFPAIRDAEDVYQDAMLKLYRALESYDDRRSFRSWLFALLHNTAISATRAGSIRQTSGFDENRDGGLSRRDIAPLDTLADAEERHDLWHAARRVLTSEQFSAVWMFYVEDMPATEIASALGRSWVSVKTMLHRARKTLQKEFADRLEKPSQVRNGGAEVKHAG